MASIKWTGFLCLIAVAQTVTAQEDNVLRVNTRLVEVDVVVHSKGQAVTGLKKDDFTIFDNGKPQKVAAFNVISSRTTPGESIPLPAGAVSNRLTAEGQEPAGLTIVLYDTLNTAAADQAWARQALLDYVDTLKSGDHFALYSLAKTLTVIQDFTGDPERIRKAARSTVPAASLDQTAEDLAADLQGSSADLGDAGANGLQQNAILAMRENAELNRAVITTKSMELIAKHVQGIPGRKKLIWISSSFPTETTDMETHLGKQTIEHKDYSDQIGRSVRTLNDANVAVYPIDPRDSYNGGLNVSGIDSMNLFAGGTGGQAFYNLTDLAGAMKTVVEDTDVTYSLGFYPGDIKLDGSYHLLSVKVARPDVDLRSRKGYYASELKRPDEKELKKSLDDVFETPLEATGIGMAALLEPVARQPGVFQLTLRFDLQELHLEREKNSWVAKIQFATYFPAYPKPNGTEESIKITLTEQRLREALLNGYILQRTIVVGNRRGDMRLAIQDQVTGAAGSVKLELAGTGKPSPKMVLLPAGRP